MIRALLSSALVFALALFAAPSLAHEPDEPVYRIRFSIIEGERTVAAIDTQAIAQTPVEASLQIDGVEWAFSASVLPFDDGVQMVIEAGLSSNGHSVASPRLTFIRGEAAGVQIGGPDRLISLEISPLD